MEHYRNKTSCKSFHNGGSTPVILALLKEKFNTTSFNFDAS